ncbi:MAG: methylmalonyl Co-A mutase-associated GTPase MeaB, partial [Myxococcales bacterium]|nr:methylmalonyl Co-A mutase-associated GTPase MeaB [Myxococcales bacterium]
MTDRLSRRDLGLLLRAIDDDDAAAETMLSDLPPAGSQARVYGFTGTPGAGKSTLVDGVIGELRSLGLTVAVLAVDPTSPFSGGAILGDRVRMVTHAQDDGVFIRSMATRGALGGLSRSTGRCIEALLRAGYDRVLVETVGVGQDEVEVVKAVDVNTVV